MSTVHLVNAKSSNACATPRGTNNTRGSPAGGELKLRTETCASIFAAVSADLNHASRSAHRNAGRSSVGITILALACTGTLRTGCEGFDALKLPTRFSRVSEFFVSFSVPSRTSMRGRPVVGETFPSAYPVHSPPSSSTGKLMRIFRKYNSAAGGELPSKETAARSTLPSRSSWSRSFRAAIGASASDSSRTLSSSTSTLNAFVRRLNRP